MQRQTQEPLLLPGVQAPPSDSGFQEDSGFSVSLNFLYCERWPLAPEEL